MLGQDVTQQRGPHKAGVQLIFVVPKEFSEHLLRQAFIVRQMVFQCKDEPCLRFHGTSAGSGKIFFLHHLPLAVGDGLVVLSCFFQTENCGRFGNDLGTCRIVDVSDVGFVRRPVNAVCNGPGTVKRMGHPDVAPLYEMKKSLDWEVDKFQGFVRFEEHDGMLGAVIHPKNYILPLLRGHFCSRFPEENFMIYDAVHQAVLLYQEHKAQLLELARAYRFSRSKAIRLIYLPSLRPYFLSALITSVGLAWKSGVAAEVLCTPSLAMGTQIYSSKLSLEIPDLFAWTAVVVALSLALERGLRLMLEQKGGTQL